MADEWIKVRRNLGNHPKIVRMMSALLADKFRTVGGLHAVWSVFDEFSEDGVLNGYSASIMDLTIGWPGFCEAMVAVGWLIDNGSSLAVPEFDEHNGASGKRRAQDAKRKRGVRNLSEESPHAKRTNCGLEEEGYRALKKELTELPTRDGGSFRLTEELLSEYRSAFPRIDIASEMAKMRAWLASNASNRKTGRGMPKFINAWLQRAAKDARPTQPTMFESPALSNRL